MPRPSAERLPDRGATMPMTRVPLLLSQVLPPPVPPASFLLVPQAVSPRAPARIAAVTLVRLRVMLLKSFPAAPGVPDHARASRLSRALGTLGHPSVRWQHHPPVFIGPQPEGDPLCDAEGFTTSGRRARRRRP